MAAPRNNLLLQLHRWAHRQDENFCTEVLAHLLRHLLAEEPEAAVRFLEGLTGGFLQVGSANAREVAVQTQATLSEGTPDLKISTPSHLALVEAKVESPVRPDQMRRYRQVLSESGAASTALILLTRYPVILTEGSERPDAVIRWYHVAEWLEQESTRYRFKPVSGFLVDQFLGFLGARNMVIEQVSWELTGGIRALRALTDMLREAAAYQKLPAQPRAQSDYMGIKLGTNLKRPDYYLGIYFDRPEVLVFETAYAKVDPQAAAQPGIEGEVYEWASGNGYGWRRELNLLAEESAFFVRTRARQIQLLDRFLRECLERVRQIQLPAEAAPPEVGEPVSGEGEDAPLPGLS